MVDNLRRGLAGIALVLLLWAAAAEGAAWRREQSISGDFATAVALAGGGDVFASVDTSPDHNDFIVTRIAGATGAEMWRKDVLGGDSFSDNLAWTVTATAAGDVVAAGELDDAVPSATSLFAVVKLNGATGAELWRYVLGGSDAGSARDVVSVSGGDIVAAGQVRHGFDTDLVVVRLNGATGAEIWRREIDGTSAATSDEGASAVAIDGAGDVLVAGFLTNTATGRDLAVRKLAGATGADVWSADVDGGTGSDNDVGYAIDILPGDDVIAAGTTGDADGSLFTVIRLAEATGAEIWRYAVRGTATGRGLAWSARVDAGDVVAAGFLSGPTEDFTVVKIDGGIGAELWRYRSDGPTLATADGGAQALTLDGAGDVIAIGNVAPAALPLIVPVVKIDGASGDEIWRQELQGSVVFGRAIVAVPSGDVVVAGYGARLSGLDGTVGPVYGRRLQVTDVTANPSADRIEAQMSSHSIVTSPPGSAGDPTIGGATLKLVNTTTAESAVFSLPSGGWKGLGIPAGSTGYLYLDSGGTNGPCRLVRARPRRAIKASCSGRTGAIPFTLDEPSQGTLTVSLRLGTADAQCATFADLYVVYHDEGGPDGGVFRAGRAQPATGTCP